MFDGAALPDAVIDARYAASLDPEVVANPPLVRPKDLPDPRVLDLTLDPRLSGAGNTHARPLGRRGSRQPGERRPIAAGADAELRPLSVQPHRPLGAVGARRRVQRGDDRPPVAVGDRLTRPLLKRIPP